MNRLLAVLAFVVPATAARADQAPRADRADPSERVIQAATCDAKNKTLTLSAGNVELEVTGTCDKITIQSAGNKVRIASAKNLAITGSKNEILVDRADKIAVLGSNNKIVWGGGLTITKPKIASIGKGNTIARLPPPEK